MRQTALRQQWSEAERQSTMPEDLLDDIGLLPAASGSRPRTTAARRHKPLIVRGARQVGKTWLVEHVAATGFETVVKVDLEKRRDRHVHFGDNLDPRGTVRHLEVDSDRRIVPGKTLLFLDEIQACPRAIDMIWGRR